MEEYGIFGCCQQKGWFDERVGPKYIEQILEPYLAGKTQDAMIMLDHFKCHRQQSFVKWLSSIGCDVDYIPAGSTCLLQPVDVGYNVPFKRQMKQQHSSWCIENYVDIDEHAPFPVPEREDIINWVNQSMAEIDPEIVCKTFLSIRYLHPEDHGIDFH
jgi:DDE superfamily endonuclease